MGGRELNKESEESLNAHTRGKASHTAVWAVLLKPFGASSEIEDVVTVLWGKAYTDAQGKETGPCDVSRISWLAARSAEKLWKRWRPGGHGATQPTRPWVLSIPPWGNY